MSLGWLLPCFDVADLARSLAFYAGAGFRQVGGAPADGWAIVANGPVELGLYHRHFSAAWMLNFRGGDVPAIAAYCQALGIPPASQSRYAEDGCGDCLIHDPEGRAIYFDTYSAERTRFLAGGILATDGYEGSYSPDQPRLGVLQVELHTPDQGALTAFYQRLGLSVVQPAGAGCPILSCPGQSWRLAIVAAPTAGVRFAVRGPQSAGNREFSDPDGHRFALLHAVAHADALS
jgi:hypothetical protein